MFKEITINNFRGIRTTSISGLKNVNLFFGKNNCGKSSVLDAIFLICGQSNPTLPLNINFFRGYSKVSRNVLKMDFYQLDENKPIEITAIDGETRHLSISVFESGVDEVQISSHQEEAISSQADKRYGFRMDYSVDRKPYVSQLEILASDISKAVSRTDERYKESLNCIYLSPRYDFLASIQGLINIIQNKDEKFIIDALKLIEPSVVDFVFTGTEMLVDVGLSERIPVNLLGDGARKIVSILTAIYNCKGGVLLIDEIDNGFHYSILADLWRILLSTSSKNKVQLFVTTHDLDTIKGLVTASNITGGADEISSYKLQKLSDGELRPYLLKVSGLKYAVEQEIEVR